MDRLHHLIQTLPSNLLTAASYPDSEFIILNYGSRDNLHEWVRDNLKSWIDRGIVKYYRTQIPQHFVATHAKNIAHRQATGDILCNIDADNFIMQGFPEFLVSLLSDKKSVICSTSTDMLDVPGSCGKIAVLREHFYSVNGYDESWNMGWGWDDTNFQYRVRMHNKLEYIQLDKRWSRVLAHSNEERVKNFRDKDISMAHIKSQEWLESVARTQEYVVNKNHNWGFAPDLSSDI